MVSYGESRQFFLPDSLDQLLRRKQPIGKVGMYVQVDSIVHLQFAFDQFLNTYRCGLSLFAD